MKASVLAVIVMGCLAASASAQELYYSWENDAEGWTGFDGFSDTDGITDGSYSAIRALPAGYSNAIQSDYSGTKLPALQANTEFMVDVTFDLDVPSWQIFQIAAHIQGGGFSTGDSAVVAVISDDSTATPAGTYTLTFDYSAFSADIIAGTGWAQIRLVTGWYGGYQVPGNIYFDNLRTPAPSVLLGDANNDGVVSADDFAAVQTNFGNTGAADGLLPGDANDDGVVSADDFAAIQTNFGNVLGAAAEAAAIPEPATMTLLALGGLAVLRRRRK